MFFYSDKYTSSGNEVTGAVCFCVRVSVCVCLRMCVLNVWHCETEQAAFAVRD